MRHLPDVPMWREAAARLWSSFTRPRRLSSGGKLAIVVLVLFGVALSAYTRHYVDERVKVRIAQNCASWGADETLFNVTLGFDGPPPANAAAAVRLERFRQSLEQARDTKIELRRRSHCPPWPPPPTVPRVPASSR